MTAKREPRPSPGQALVSAVVAEMAEVGVVPTAVEAGLLDLARQLVDRLDSLERQVVKDGQVLVSPTGVVRVHPGVAEVRMIAAALPKVLAGVTVGDSTSPAHKDAVKARAAATRWRAHNTQPDIPGVRRG